MGKYTSVMAKEGNIIDYDIKHGVDVNQENAILSGAQADPSGLAAMSIMNSRYEREQQSYQVTEGVLKDLEKNLGVKTEGDFKNTVSLAAQGKFEEAGVEWRTGQDLTKKEMLPYIYKGINAVANISVGIGKGWNVNAGLTINPYQNSESLQLPIPFPFADARRQNPANKEGAKNNNSSESKENSLSCTMDSCSGTIASDYKKYDFKDAIKFSFPYFTDQNYYGSKDFISFKVPSWLQFFGLSPTENFYNPNDSYYGSRTLDFHNPTFYPLGKEYSDSLGKNFKYNTEIKIWFSYSF